MFDWYEFVENVEIILDIADPQHGSVDHLCYKEVYIFPYGKGTFLVGAYKFHMESHRDRELIELFQGSGVIICHLIRAFEAGITASNEEDFKKFTLPSCLKSGSDLFFQAFKKGLRYQTAIA